MGPGLLHTSTGLLHVSTCLLQAPILLPLQLKEFKQYPMYQWMRCGFSNLLHYDSVLRVWDRLATHPTTPSTPTPVAVYEMWIL